MLHIFQNPHPIPHYSSTIQQPPLKPRKKVARVAKKTIDAQRKLFRRYGIWGEWDNPYLIFAPKYEDAQIDVFGKIFFQGHIYRG